MTKKSADSLKLFKLTFLTVVSVKFWQTVATVPTRNAGTFAIVMAWRADTSVNNCCIKWNYKETFSLVLVNQFMGGWGGRKVSCEKVR